jgi:hypothetical protein
MLRPRFSLVRPIEVTAAEPGAAMEFDYVVHGEQPDGRLIGSVVSVEGDSERAWRTAEALWSAARHPIVRIAIYAEPHRSRFLRLVRRPATDALVGWIDERGRHDARCTHPPASG